MIYAIIGAVLLIILGSVILNLVTQEGRDYKSAMQYFSLGKYEKANEIFVRLTDRQPKKSVYKWYIGQCAEALNNYTRAAKYYKDILNRPSPEEGFTNVDIHERLADVYIKLDDLDSAEKIIQNIIAIKPHDSAGHIKLADLALAQNNFTKALNTLQKALQSDPANPELMKKLGMVHYKVKEKEKAYEYLTNYISMVSAGRDHEALIVLADVCKELEKYEDAIMYYTMCTDNEKYMGQAYLEMGYIYALQNDLPMSMKSFEKAISSDIGDKQKVKDALYQVADIKMKAGRLKEALKNWEQISFMDPEYKDVAEKIEMYSDLKKSEESLGLMSLSREDFKQLIKSVIKKLGYTIEGEFEESEKGVDKGVIRFKVSYSSSGRDYIAILETGQFSQPVGDLVVRSLLNIVKEYKANKGVFITPSTYTYEARKLSDNFPVDLVDCVKLEKILKDIKEASVQLWM